ncbi:hypothetical protein [Cumulibacter manganitolerans]|uniref:hypothetical protein n=1 Tax=Cumulibacter manganitolerans TaxID=1884992 RepID=UPI0012955148|nr:hypothetical protein [Cumulibacter manganitolerans]
MTTQRGQRRTISGGDVAALVAAFAGAFLISAGLSGDRTGLTTLLIVLGIALLLGTAVLAVRSLRDRTAELADRQRWESFEESLEDGVRFDVPEGMGYAPELPALLDDMSDIGEPSDGRARRAIVGELGEIHWCAFQHERPDGTSTVGMVGLRPDRHADRYPRLRVIVKDADAAQFDERYDVLADDDAFAGQALNDEARAELMRAAAFDWRLEGNQMITTLQRPSTPEEQIAFIEDRVEPLARVAALIPLDA